MAWQPKHGGTVCANAGTTGTITGPDAGAASAVPTNGRAEQAANGDCRRQDRESRPQGNRQREGSRVWMEGA